MCHLWQLRLQELRVWEPVLRVRCGEEEGWWGWWGGAWLGGRDWSVLGRVVGWRVSARDR